MKSEIWIPLVQPLSSGSLATFFTRPNNISSIYDNLSGSSNINLGDSSGGRGCPLSITDLFAALSDSIVFVPFNFISSNPMVPSRLVYVNAKIVSSILDDNGAVSGASADIYGPNISPLSSPMPVSEAVSQAAQLIQQALLNEK